MARAFTLPVAGRRLGTPLLQLSTEHASSVQLSQHTRLHAAWEWSIQWEQLTQRQASAAELDR